MFAQQEQRALGEPFVGVRTSQGLEPGLFPLRATGVSTQPIVEAASRFLGTLSPEQTTRTRFAVDDAEWRRWSNVDNGIYTRQGVSLKEMSSAQRAAAMDLLRATLSARGLAQAQAAMLTDRALRELNPDPAPAVYDEQLYYLTVMGTPSATEPWGWQLDGHHLVLNVFVLGDQMVMTPAFWGGEPVRWRSPDGSASYELLQREQDLGLALMQSLDERQRDEAMLAARKGREDMRAGYTRDNLVLDYAGVRASTLTATQRAQLVELIGLYVGTLRQDHARVTMDEVLAHLDETRFAWVGETSDDAVFYYRIHSPVILIEFDHQAPVGLARPGQAPVPVRDHIHTIVRTPNGNDYGKDWLGQHLRAAHNAR